MTRPENSIRSRPGGRRRQEQGFQLRGQTPGGIGRPAYVGAGLHQPVQGDEQRVRLRVRRVHVYPYGDGVPHRVRDLPCGGEGLVGGLRADAGDLAELVAPGSVDPADRGVPRLLQRAEPQPALGDVRQPGGGDGGQFETDEGVQQGAERGVRGLDGAPVVVQYRAGRAA